MKIYPQVVGNTLGSHEKFLKKLKKKGAKIVTTEDEDAETIVFCPIVSRFETDIQSAISSTSKDRKVILVAMHHTYDPNYTLPDRRSYDSNSVKLLVECLFFEKKGLYKCPRNSKAKKSVCDQLGLKKINLLRKSKKSKREKQEKSSEK